MKTKEIAFTLPVIIFVYEFMFLEGNLKSRVLFLFPYCITMLIIPFAVLDVNRPVGDMFSDVGQVLRDETNMSRWDYLFTQFRVIPTYIRLLLLPIKQNLDYDFPVSQSIFEPQVFVSFLFLIAIVAFSIYAFFKNKDKAPEIRLITFGTIWFFITLSVESSIIPILDVFFEHRIYLPSFGFLMAISIIFIVFTSQHGKKTTRKILFVTSIGIAIILTVTTFNRNKVWKNELSLWHDVVRKSPNKARGYNYLGLAYSASNEYDKAINYFKQSIKLDRYYANPHSNLGIAYFNKGLIDESIHQFQQAILINPSHAEAHYNLGIAYGSKGLMKEAYIEMKKGSALSRTNK
jgi:tetratricopeptide (TPR) repeat protein